MNCADMTMGTESSPQIVTMAQNAADTYMSGAGMPRKEDSDSSSN